MKSPVINLEKDVVIYNNEIYTLDAKNPGMTYLWNTNETTQSINLSEEGIYSVVVTNSNGCSSTDETKVKVYKNIEIPNTFTPNQDGTNDLWIIVNLQEYIKANVKVFNRWGNLVYDNYGIYTPWDGKKNGKDLPVATYYYVIVLNDIKNQIYSGTVTIVK